MADHTATLAVNLEDGTSAPALKAKDALKQLQGQIAADTKALAQMQKAFKNLNQGSVVNIEQANKLKAAMKATKERIAGAQSSVLALGGGFRDVTPKGNKMQQMLEEMAKQSQAMPGPIGGLVAQFKSLGGLLAGGAIALGIVAVTAALIALTAAAAAAIIMLARYGIAQADARRNEALRLEGLTKLRFWYRATAGSASELQSTVDKVSANSAVGRGELIKYTEQLYKMGLRGQNLEYALEGVAIKASTQGSAAANAFAGMAAGAALSGRSVKALSDTVKARLGGIAARQMLSLGVQSEKLKESFDALFRDIKLDGFLAGLKEIYSLFSQNTATGRALKSLLQGIIQPLIDGVSAAAPYVKVFFQGLLLGALEIGIAVLKLRKWFLATFGGGELFKGVDKMNLAFKLGKIVVYELAAVFAGLALAVVLASAPIWALGVALFGVYKVGKAVYGFFAGIDWGAIGKAFGLIWKEVKNVFAMIDWGQLGLDILWGIVGGIKAAGKLVLGEALTGLATGAWDTFRTAIGAHSPSKEFAKLGVTIPQGIAQGVEQGAPTAQGAVDSLVGMPGGGGAGAAGGGARGSAVTIGELHFHASNESQPKAMADELRRELERVLEGLAISLGAPVPGVV